MDLGYSKISLYAVDATDDNKVSLERECKQ